MSTDDELSQIEESNRGSLISCDCGQFWLDAGMYPIEGFILFQIGLFEITRTYPGKQVVVLHLHVGYFHLDFGWVTK